MPSLPSWVHLKFLQASDYVRAELGDLTSVLLGTVCDAALHLLLCGCHLAIVGTGGERVRCQVLTANHASLHALLKMGELRSHNLLHLLHRLLALLQTGTMSCEMSEERNA
uniref:Uncharacterized protein n=1 Tax=Tetraselmis chuii TaxID=63592 RepID=A0A7S1T606_9CHLO